MSKAKLKAAREKWQEPSDVIAYHRDLAAIAHQVHKSRWPLLVGQECYEYIGEWVSIVDVHICGQVEDYDEVTIETRSANRATVTFTELEWKYGRVLSTFIRESRLAMLDLTEILKWAS